MKLFQPKGETFVSTKVKVRNLTKRLISINRFLTCKELGTYRKGIKNVRATVFDFSIHLILKHRKFTIKEFYGFTEAETEFFFYVSFKLRPVI